MKDKVHIIELSDLSSGEKQLLILLFTVFLQDQKPCVILLDEPEISLHIEWQDILIETLIALNPNAQFIIVTHSPSVFGKGWGDKLIFMEDIFISSKLVIFARYLALKKDSPHFNLSLEEMNQLMLNKLNRGEEW